jgi:signal transduction histidine kinase
VQILLAAGRGRHLGDHSSRFYRVLERLRRFVIRVDAHLVDQRRRLERNLHDGAQQHLVALKVKLVDGEPRAA